MMLVYIFSTTLRILLTSILAFFCFLVSVRFLCVFFLVIYFMELLFLKLEHQMGWVNIVAVSQNDASLSY